MWGKPHNREGDSQTKVKVPKCLLSVKQKGVFEQRQQGGRLRSSILQRVRNSSPAELGSPENGRGSSRPPIL